MKCEALETFRGQKMCIHFKMRRSRFVKSERSRPERIREAATRSIDLLEIDFVRIDESFRNRCDDNKRKNIECREQLDGVGRGSMSSLFIAISPPPSQEGGGGQLQ